MIKAAVMCLALAIYHESRGEPERGQYAVGEVVLNRASKKNISLCDVIYEKGQFHNSLKWTIPNDESWSRSLTIANNLIENKTNYTNGAMYFHIKSIKSKQKDYILIGNHIFYR